jgi:protein involved in polysaccharide export with SLBB domain
MSALLLSGCKMPACGGGTPLPGVRSDAHFIKPDDHLNVVIANRECPEIRQVVDVTGHVLMPFAIKLHVAGMTLDQAAKAIEAAYLPSCFREPLKVSVSKL